MVKLLLGLAHAPALVAAASGPRDTYHFTLVPPDLAAMRAYIESARADEAAGRALPFATVSRASGQVVGSTRFGNIEFWPWPAGNLHQRGAERPDVVEIVTGSSSWRHIVAMPVHSVSP